jgi:hypothetical protein
MRFEEVLPVLKKSKSTINGTPKKLAPALYYSGTEWVLGGILFASKKAAKEYHGERRVIWPAVPNKDGFYIIEVPHG